jgi:hypothetical protein
MNEWQIIAALAAAGMFFIAIISNIVLVTLKISSIKSDILKELSQIEAQRDNEIMSIRQLIHDQQTSSNLRYFQLETFVRDTFLRKDSFKDITAEISTDVKDLANEMKGRLLRMEAAVISAFQNINKPTE